MVLPSASWCMRLPCTPCVPAVRRLPWLDHAPVCQSQPQEPEFFTDGCNLEPLACPADKQKEYVLEVRSGRFRCFSANRMKAAAASL